jgi:hypothetical protein
MGQDALQRLDFAAYAALDAVNWSTLKECRKSPKHYKHRLGVPREDTTSLKVGRATHTAVFEPDRFAVDYAVFKGERRAGKEWAAFCEAHPNETIIKLDEYERCIAMRDAVRSHPVAGPLLAHGVAERAITWTDTATGLHCKARLDWLGLVLGDLKTTGEIERVRFGMNAARMGYHEQMAFYTLGLRANGIDVPAKLIAVEAAAPHDVAVFGVSDDDLYVGELEVQKLLRLVAECRERQEWPGIAPAEMPLMLPSWVFDSTADDDDANGLDLMVSGQEV